MQSPVEYTLIFAATVLLQVMLFDNLNISPYIYPLVYTGFIVLLPMNMNNGAVLLLSFAAGCSVDLLSGTPGLNTIASLASGFVRPAALNLTLGRDAARENIMPLPLAIGRNKWLRYTLLIISVHCLVFFFFEAASFRYVGFTILRSLGSIASTTLLVWFVASLLPSGQRHGAQG